MSDTVTAAQAEKQAIRSGILRVAKDVPTAIAIAKGSDPELAGFLTGKGLAQSKTVWISLLTPIISALVTHYGLGWDDATVGSVAMALTSIGVIIARCFTSVPITGAITAAPVQPAPSAGPSAAP